MIGEYAEIRLHASTTLPPPQTEDTVQYSKAWADIALMCKQTGFNELTEAINKAYKSGKYDCGSVPSTNAIQPQNHFSSILCHCCPQLQGFSQSRMM